MLLVIETKHKHHIKPVNGNSKADTDSLVALFEMVKTTLQEYLNIYFKCL